MSKYKVYYEGFAYVEADSEEEAEDKFYSDESYYNEHEITRIDED